jgi:Uma2 family endonuclease
MIATPAPPRNKSAAPPPDDAVPQIPPGFEFIDGELVEKNMGAESSWVAGEVFDQVRSYCRRTQFGVAFIADAGFQCFPHKPNQVRKPDVAALPCDPRTFVLPKGWIESAPALAVEVVSPNETAYELADKVFDYRTAGVPLVWVIDPHLRQATVHRADGTITQLTDPGELSGENVLPGLTIMLASVLPQVEVQVA